MAASFKVPIYSGKIIICTKRNEWNKAHKHLEGKRYAGISRVDGLSGRYADKKKRSIYLVGVFDGSKQTLVHELVHTCFEILTYSGIPIKRSNDETFAYLMTALYKASITAMRS